MASNNGMAKHAHVATPARMGESGPTRIVTFLRRELVVRDGVAVTRFDLVQCGNVGEPQMVSEFEPRGAKLEELAQEIYEAALDDSEASAELGATSYAVISRRANGRDGGARCVFRVPIPTGNEGQISERADTKGVIALSMRHLQMQLAGAQNLLLAAITTNAEAGSRQNEGFEKLAIGYRDFAESTTKGYERALSTMSAINAALLDHMQKSAERDFDTKVLLEDLLSQKSTRDLETKKVERKLARGDRTFDEFFKVFWPILVKKGMEKLGGGGGEAPPAAAAGASSPAPAPPVPLSESEARDLFMVLANLLSTLDAEKQAALEAGGLITAAQRALVERFRADDVAALDELLTTITDDQIHKLKASGAVSEIQIYAVIKMRGAVAAQSKEAKP